jgi:thioredoxin reductase
VKVNDVVIIGAGPAGISTAIQLKRHGIEPILLEREEVGGLLKNANLIENYLGFPDGITGPEIIDLFKKQLKNTRVNADIEKVLELDFSNDIFLIKTDQRTFSCSIVVIATGTKPSRLSEIRFPENAADRIFYEINTLRNAANEKIAIIGSGDLAFDYALNLSIKNDVTILNRGEKAKCLLLLWERAKRNEKISYIENTQVKKVDCLDGRLVLTCHNAVHDWKTSVSYLVIAIGREPNLDFLSNRLRRNLDQLQNKKLLYQVGDVKNGICRQTASATGDGIKAAMEIYRTLKGVEKCE